MIEVDNIIYRTKDFTVRFNFHLPDKAMLVLTGPSGGGKTTLFYLLAGFATAQSGHIRIAGKDITHAPPAQRPLSLLFQEHNLFAHLNVLDNAGLGLCPNLQLSAADKIKIADALARVGLEARQYSMPETLSGGEKQRVAIARALLRDKPILLLDEAFSGLGPKMRREMLGLVQELQRERGLLVILTSHEPDDIRQTNDLAGYIADGELKILAPAQEFLRHGLLKYYF